MRGQPWCIRPQLLERSAVSQCSTLGLEALEAAAPEHQEAQAATALEALEAAAPEAQEAAGQAVPVAPAAPPACARNTTSAPPSEAMRDSERC